MVLPQHARCSIPCIRCAWLTAVTLRQTAVLLFHEFAFEFIRGSSYCQFVLGGRISGLKPWPIPHSLSPFRKFVQTSNKVHVPMKIAVRYEEGERPYLYTI